MGTLDITLNKNNSRNFITRIKISKKAKSSISDKCYLTPNVFDVNTISFSDFEEISLNDGDPAAVNIAKHPSRFLMNNKLIFDAFSNKRFNYCIFQTVKHFIGEVTKQLGE